jgi:hypothetical protein
MKHLTNKKGVALVVVLAIVVVCTAMVAVVLHFIQRGTETSGLEQKYATAKDASLGALDVFAKEIIPMAIGIAQVTPASSMTNALTNFSSIASATITAGVTDGCFSDKLLKSTASWAACGASNSTSDPKTAPDITFTLQGASQQPFRVFAKIVDTVSGNSNTSSVLLEGTGVAEGSGAVVSIQHFPYMYSMEVQGERQLNPTERANFEVLYAY